MIIPSKIIDTVNLMFCLLRARSLWLQAAAGLGYLALTEVGEEAMLILFLTGLLFLVLGVLIKHLKWYWLISGYNTMTKEKKRNVDIEGLGKFLGNSLFVMAGLMITSSLFFHYNSRLAATVATFFIVPLIIFILIKAQKFDGNTRNADGTMNRSTKIIIGSIIVFFVGIGVIILISAQTPEILISAETVQIKGLYGIEIDRSDINDVNLVDIMPAVIRKTNGFDCGNILKGNFLLQGGVKAKLYVNAGKPPFIEITTQEGLIILNQGNPERTAALFQSLLHD
ncbi:MAG: DUF3784 domain-containing protein [Dethiobacteria bacterium]